MDDYWEPGKGLLVDPGRFLESLFKYDKDNIPDPVIIKIQPYIDDENFTPAAISKVSQLGPCMLMKAFYVCLSNYYHIYFPHPMTMKFSKSFALVQTIYIHYAIKVIDHFPY